MKVSSKNFYPETFLTRELFCVMHLICFVHFPKEYSSTFVTACSLIKLSMQISSITKIKSCYFSNNEFYCLLRRLFLRFQEIWIVKRQIWFSIYLLGVLSFTMMVFYGVWFLVAEKIFLSISIICHIFHVFLFWCFDQDSHRLVN